jgi:hypothetical protein
MDDTTADELERELVSTDRALTEPDGSECVLCYVDRMLSAFGCDGTLRWVRRWRDLQRPRVTGLERRMEARGGFCDCEVFFNGWTFRTDLLEPDEEGALTEPATRPLCAGVGPRSSQPCANWTAWRRPRW